MDGADPGEAGVRAPCCKLLEFCRIRLRPKRSPKLLRPVDDDVRVVPGNCSSFKELLPTELVVEDLSLRPGCIRVGDDWPEFREFGRNNAVAGDPAVFTERLGPWAVLGTRVVPSLAVEGRELSGVVFGRTRDAWDPFNGDTPGFPFCCWRWAIGNNGSGCFGFRRKKVEARETGFCPLVFDLFDLTGSSPPPSDLDDSDLRFADKLEL